jgi:hypothetical protein
MRSRTFVALATVCAFAACRSQDDVVRDLCQKLDDCVGVPPYECSSRIDEAVKDRRLSTASLAKCSDCVKTNDCRDVLDERDCDGPCQDLAVVLNARTQPNERRLACSIVRNACMDRSDSTACADSLDGLLQKDASFSVDIAIDACVSCLVPLSQANDTEEIGVGAGAGGSGGSLGTTPDECGATQASAGAGGAHAVVSFEGLALCSSLIERCATICANVEAYSTSLERAAGAVAVCSRGEACVTGSDPGSGGAAGQAGTTGSSGFGGEAGVPGAGGSDDTKECANTAFERCYAKLFESGNATAVKQCSICLSNNFDCASAAATCRSECVPLFGEQKSVSPASAP